MCGSSLGAEAESPINDGEWRRDSIYATHRARSFTAGAESLFMAPFAPYRGRALIMRGTMRTRITSSLFIFLFVFGFCVAARPANAQIGEDISALGDDIQHVATKGKDAVVKAGRHVGNDVAPVTDKVGDALEPVGKAVAPVTDPVGESAGRIYHDASGLVGGSHAPDGGEAALKKGINCATAKQDIATLKSEKAGVGSQIMAGLSSVFPVSAVCGLLKGNYSENVRVSAGQYNADIDRKIAQIQSVCGVS